MSGRLGATGNLVGNAQSVQFAQIFTVNGVEYGFDIYISPAGSSIFHLLDLHNEVKFRCFLLTDKLYQAAQN